MPDSSSAFPLLELRNVTVAYGAVTALKKISLHVHAGEIVTLIGANGAGKTTTLKAISGLIRPRSGHIFYRGEDITHTPAHVIVKQGLVHTPEGRGIFLNLTVAENLDLGGWAAPDAKTFAHDQEQVFGLFPRLKERRNQIAGTLSGGEQQMLAIGRALLSHPTLMLFDEPSLGLAPQMIETIFSIITKINRDGKTILLVEQNAHQALHIAQRGIVLETGQITSAGSASELLHSDDIKKAYLGG